MDNSWQRILNLCALQLTWQFYLQKSNVGVCKLPAEGKLAAQSPAFSAKLQVFNQPYYLGTQNESTSDQESC